MQKLTLREADFFRIKQLRPQLVATAVTFNREQDSGSMQSILIWEDLKKKV